MNFIEELQWRGLLKEMTEGLEDALNQEGPKTAYIGYDPTAPSLTIGNLVTIMLLKHWQRAGYRPIVLLGGATGRIGDPSFKDEERQLLDYDTLQANIDRQTAQFKQLLDFEGENPAILLNNYDFYKGMSIFDFLRDIGKNVTVSYMMAKESVKKRLETGLSFTEFSYQLIQGNDFHHLNKNYDCLLQMGGSDQWGNITTGTEFVRKGGGKGYGLVCPLLTKSDGKKFGKSEKGNIWLDAEKTSPYQFYQFWLNVDDADLSKLIRIFSLKSREEIEALEAEYAENPRGLKEVLAEEMTIRLHGEEALASAQKATNIAFSKKLKAEFLESLSAKDFAVLAQELEVVKVAKSQLEAGISLAYLLVGKHKSLGSNGDLRRAVKGGAIALNAKKVSDFNQELSSEDLLAERYLFCQNGKKNKFIVIAE